MIETQFEASCVIQDTFYEADIIDYETLRCMVGPLNQGSYKVYVSFNNHDTSTTYGVLDVWLRPHVTWVGAAVTNAGEEFRFRAIGVAKRTQCKINKHFHELVPYEVGQAQPFSGTVTDSMELDWGCVVPTNATAAVWPFSLALTRRDVPLSLRTHHRLEINVGNSHSEVVAVKPSTFHDPTAGMSTYQRAGVENFLPKVFPLKTRIGVVVTGRNFPVGSSIQCRFMDKTLRKVYHKKLTPTHVKSSKQIYCDTPILKGAERPLDLFLDFSDQPSVYVGELSLKPQSFKVSRTSAHIPLTSDYATPPIIITSSIPIFSPVGHDMYRCRWQLLGGDFLDVDAVLSTAKSWTKSSSLLID